MIPLYLYSSRIGDGSCRVGLDAFWARTSPMAHLASMAAFSVGLACAGFNGNSYPTFRRFVSIESVRFCASVYRVRSLRSSARIAAARNSLATASSYVTRGCIGKVCPRDRLSYSLRPGDDLKARD